MIELSVSDLGHRVWSVAALVRAVAETLASRFAACTVKGELSGFSRAGSGHCYFNLKDAEAGGATLRCAMFRRAAGLLDFAPAEGQLVELRGRLAVYEPRGELQFVAETMQRAGDGALFEKFLRLKAALEAEGLFDAGRKRELPENPRRLGVVTSLGAAALGDVCAALARRAPHVGVIVYPSLVQGEAAPEALVAAIALAGLRREVDTLLVCRGGGSLEDLWAFNDERVVRAIARCPLPVVCGIGHETDVTLADFAADRRAATPTAAAELAAPVRQERWVELLALADQLGRRAQRALDAHAQRLDACSLRLSRPSEGVRQHHQRLALLGLRLNLASRRDGQLRADRLDRIAQRQVHAARVLRVGQAQRLESLAARLHALDPRKVLGRGYAWLSDGAGMAVTSIAAVAPGMALHVALVDGEADVTVRQVTAHDVPRAVPAAPTA